MSQKHKRWAWMKGHTSLQGTAVVIVLTLAISFLTFIMSQPVLTIGTVIVGVIIILREAVAYLGEPKTAAVTS